MYVIDTFILLLANRKISIVSIADVQYRDVSNFYIYDLIGNAKMQS